MHVSNFRPVKRVRDVVRIFARVNAQMPSILVMVGDGPERPAAEEEARMLGVSDSIFFLGKIDSVAPLLSDADVFLLPSQSESFGLSALEALAAGVPVVGSDAGGLPEVVASGETGLLYPVGDVESMAAGVLSILGDPARKAAMSAAAMADARARFSLDTIVSQYEGLYRSAISAPSHSRG
jgi:N-acetyl-alpha-D-glucosaminyl L-malate synthase BshA